MPLLICPNCNVGMTQASRAGIEIDICPQCRGVWLDRGELEKLLEPARSEFREEMPRSPRQDYHRDDHDDHRDERGQYGRRRNSIFDIFD